MLKPDAGAPDSGKIPLNAAEKFSYHINFDYGRDTTIGPAAQRADVADQRWNAGPPTLFGRIAAFGTRK